MSEKSQLPRDVAERAGEERVVDDRPRIWVGEVADVVAFEVEVRLIAVHVDRRFERGNEREGGR
jgi:hypothetical protein